MNIKMTDEWKKKIIENYEYEGEHYYQYIKRCRQSREKLGIEDSKKMFDMVLEVLEERRKQGIVDYGYKDQFIGVKEKK